MRDASKPFPNSCQVTSPARPRQPHRNVNNRLVSLRTSQPRNIANNLTSTIFSPSQEMLPPIEESVLQANPKFAALHTVLAQQILNPDGSTKSHPAQKARDGVSEALNTSRIRSAKSQILKSALRNLDLSSPDASTTSTSKPIRQSQSQSQAKPRASLPPELLELILLLSSCLSSPQALPHSHSALLASTPQWTSLHTHLPQISGLLSTHLQTQTLALCKILTPSTNPSFLHRAIPKLLPAATSLRDSNAHQRAALAQRRAALVGNATTLLTLHHLAASLVIRILEQTTHGALARHLRARTEFLALKAQQVACEAAEKQAKGERIVYSEEVSGALENYVRGLRDGRERGRERKRMAERTLWGYGVGRGEGEGEGEGEDGEKARVLRSVAKAYGELLREIEEVGRDVQRLKGR